MQDLPFPFGDVVTVCASLAFATANGTWPQHGGKTTSERRLHQRPTTSPGKMRRFGVDQITANFSPQTSHHRTVYRRPSRVPYSHIQVVPKAEPPVQNENGSPQVTFRKPSYSEEAKSNMATAAGPSQPAPTATLANMTLGTTFAQKARAAELNAVLARKAVKGAADNDNGSSGTPASLGALKLTKPRARGKSWQKLNLDEIPETTSEANQPGRRQPSATTSSTLSGSDLEQRFLFPNPPPAPHAVYQPAVAVNPQQFVYYGPQAQGLTAIPHTANGMVTPNAFLSPEHFRQQMMHFNQMAMRRNAHLMQTGSPALAPAFQPSITPSPEQMVQQSRMTEDDPFVDMPKTAYRQTFHGLDCQPQQPPNANADSSRTAQPAVSGMMSYECRFPTEQQQSHTVPHPPGLPNRPAHLPAVPDEQNSATNRQPAPTADTHQRDPKPYTSFAKSTIDSSKRDQLMHHLQEVVDVAKAEGNLPSSSRTVLYDAVARDITETSGVYGRNVDDYLPPSTKTAMYDPTARDATGTTGAHRATISQSGNDFLQTSDPLPWKNRPVDIYNMVPPASVPPGFGGNDRALAVVAGNAGLQGNAYIQSLVPQTRSSEQRLKDTEAWWHYDGRGQEPVRAYLEHVADEHRKKKIGRDYESIKKALERQASFRDDWSDQSDSTTVPEARTAGDVINRLMGPVMASLHSYVQEGGPSYFNKFSKAPAWAVDGGIEGNKSFFGEDWGKPPSRVGRDPRYRPTFHEGRYTVFEPNDGRVSGRGW
ncbi:MAG: hypothetical protein Q9201_005917 [Fulgogasparrea decipioides]